MKNTKKIINITGILILAGTIFYFLIKDSADILNKDINLPDKPVAIVNSDIQSSEDNIVQDNSKDVTKNLTENLYANLEYNSDTLLEIYHLCGYDSKLIDEIVLKFEGSNNLLEVQIKAANKILEECDKWHVYIDTLSKEQLELLEKNRIDLVTLDRHFNTFKPYSKKLLDEAREFMSLAGDSSGATEGALRNLLSQDYNFIGEVAKKVGTRDLKYITDNSYNIAMLYVCEVSPQDCSADSIRTLSLCVEFEYMCGRSYTEYYATTVTPNHFADMMNIVDTIRVLIKQGYFD